MGFKYSAAVFGMELNTNKPFVGGNFHNFNQRGVRIYTG